MTSQIHGFTQTSVSEPINERRSLPTDALTERFLKSVEKLTTELRATTKENRKLRKGMIELLIENRNLKYVIIVLIVGFIFNEVLKNNNKGIL